MFDDAKVQSVYEDYQNRADSELSILLSPGAFERTDLDNYLLPVGPDVGRFLHALILAKKPQRIAEIGTSYGYSTLFLADAARTVGAKVITMDVAENKHDYAREQLKRADLLDVVDFRLGDAIGSLEADPGPFDFALLDIWKDLYVPAFEALYPKLSDEGVVVSDNMITPPEARNAARALREAITSKPDMQSVLLPMGQGVELSVKWPSNSASL